MNGADIPGATNLIYNLAAARLSDAGLYSVLIKTGSGSVPSSNSVVTVVKDTSPPMVNEIVSYDGLSVGVKFDKLIDPVSAANIANYSVNETLITNATLLFGGRTVALNLA